MDKISEAKLTRRIEFSKKTRMLLAERAGNKCSFRHCLIETIGPATTVDGADNKAGIAVAAHIFAASGNGPRKQRHLTPEQIKHISNGIWMCSNHGRLIDVFQSDYPPETVIQMKMVREFAQKLTLVMPEISFFAPKMSVERLDEIVWKHLPDLDPEQIRSAVIAEGVRWISIANSDVVTAMPVPPSNFSLKPLAGALRDVVVELVAPVVGVLVTPIRGATFPAERLRAVQLVSAWAEAVKPYGWNGESWHVHHGHVRLTARNTSTGELFESSVWAQGRVMGLHRFTPVDGENVGVDVAHTFNRTNNLDWHLKVTVKEGACHTKSTLTTFGIINPKNSHEPYEQARFEAYEKVMEKLADGWEPIGFVSLTPGEWAEPDTVHPDPFAIECKISAVQFAESLHRCTRVRLGYQLGERWGVCFFFTSEFFNDNLDENTILEASQALLEKIGPAPYQAYGHTETLVMLGERHGIRLSFKLGNMFFERTLIRQPGSRW